MVRIGVNLLKNRTSPVKCYQPDANSIPAQVVLDTATRLEDGAVIAAKQPLVHMKTTDKYTVDLMAANPPPGFYELVLTASPTKPDAR